VYWDALDAVASVFAIAGVLQLDVAIAERLSSMAEEAMRQPGRHGDAG
jgi:hypothetical protein